jgi:hypothetical protein
MINKRIAVKNLLEDKFGTNLSEDFYNDFSTLINDIYEEKVSDINFDFKPLLKSKVSNKELLEYSVNNISKIISPKKATILFKDYLIRNKINFQKTNTGGIRGFKIAT